MTFISLKFYAFLIVVIAAYYVIPIKYRWYSLLAGSMAFYWYVTNQSVVAFTVLVGLAFVSWFFGKYLAEQNERNKAIFAVVAIGLVAIPLLLLKGSQLLLHFFPGVSTPGWWIAPVGLSFYTLQLVSYCVDVYKGKIEPEKNFLKFLLFASYFPQIIQGPIPRYSQLENQLIEGHKFDDRKFVKGFMLILWAFFLKMCIADKAAIVVNTIFSNYQVYGGLYALVGGILYSFQLYADFLSCTSFAQGFSNLLGIDLVDNFSRPYFANSIKDFWRRWHISLSSWLRDYVYIPLGGNRKGQYRKYLNIIIVFAISGFWHGDGIKFIFWGVLHGVYQVAGELLLPVRRRINELMGINADSSIGNGIKAVGTFFLVMLGWIIFRADSLSVGLSMIKSIFSVHNIWILTGTYLFELGLGWKEFFILILCLIVLLSVSIAQELGIVIRDRILEHNIVVRWTIYIITIVFIMLFGTYGWGYDSQAFIYGGF